MVVYVGPSTDVPLVSTFEEEVCHARTYSALNATCDQAHHCAPIRKPKPKSVYVVLVDEPVPDVGVNLLSSDHMPNNAVGPQYPATAPSPTQSHKSAGARPNASSVSSDSPPEV